MHFSYIYFMKDERERINAVAPRHAAYWQGRRLTEYQGGPFADRSGGLITFEIHSSAIAEQLVANDPFVSEQLLEQRWLKNGWSSNAAHCCCPSHSPGARTMTRREPLLVQAAASG